MRSAYVPIGTTMRSPSPECTCHGSGYATMTWHHPWPFQLYELVQQSRPLEQGLDRHVLLLVFKRGAARCRRVHWRSYALESGW